MKDWQFAFLALSNWLAAGWWVGGAVSKG